MTGAAKTALFAVLLIYALKFCNTGFSTTASYEELLAAVKSGRFTVDKTDKNKGSNEDLLQEILDKSKFCYFKQTMISRPSGKTLYRTQNFKLKTRLYYSISSLNRLHFEII